MLYKLVRGPTIYKPKDCKVEKFIKTLLVDKRPMGGTGQHKVSSV